MLGGWVRKKQTIPSSLNIGFSSHDVTLRTLHLPHWSLSGSDSWSKPVISHTNSKQEADKDAFLSQRRSVPFLLHEFPTPRFNNRMGSHNDGGWGWDKAAVGGDKRCFYKLGIALVIVHLVEALEHAVHDLHKKWINAKSLHRLIREAVPYQPPQTHQVKCSKYWEIKLLLTLIQKVTLLAKK